MSPINSRQKGKRGELELCHTLKGLFGWDAERSVQHCGNAGDSDLIVKGFPNLFVECKRVEQLNLTKAMELAKQQAGQKVPVIFHRKDREEWMVTVPLPHLLHLSLMLAAGPRLIQQEPSAAIWVPDTTWCPPPGFAESQKPWPTERPSTEKETG